MTALQVFLSLWIAYGPQVGTSPKSEELCVALETMSREQRDVVLEAFDKGNMNGTFDYCF